MELTPGTTWFLLSSFFALMFLIAVMEDTFHDR